MKKILTPTGRKRLWLSVMLGLGLLGPHPIEAAETSETLKEVRAIEKISKADTSRPIGLNKLIKDTYILGPGDTLEIEIQDIPELSGLFNRSRRHSLFT